MLLAVLIVAEAPEYLDRELSWAVGTLWDDDAVSAVNGEYEEAEAVLVKSSV